MLKLILHLFQENKSYGVKPNLHSSSDVTSLYIITSRLAQSWLIIFPQTGSVMRGGSRLPAVG
jgi:hypothetical protein